MRDILEVPAERDIPAGRSRRMRAGLMAAVAERPRWKPRRLVVAVAAVAGIAALVVPTVIERDQEQVLAMSAAELSPSLRKVIAQCLKWAPESPAADAGRVAMAARRGGRAVVVFLTPDSYLACDVIVRRFQEPVGTTVDGRLAGRDSMPGPVQRLSLSSSEPDGGEVIVAGRVSERVHRIALDHGNGRHTEGRIEHGLFGLIGDGDVRPGAQLVSYGADDREIGRQRLFGLPEERGGTDCYVDSSGTVIQGTRSPGCRPAERWVR